MVSTTENPEYTETERDRWKKMAWFSVYTKNAKEAKLRYRLRDLCVLGVKISGIRIQSCEGGKAGVADQTVKYSISLHSPVSR